MGIKLKNNKFALSSEMVIVAVTTLFLMTTTITAVTQQSVYAQPQQPKGQGACPEGFELNRGVCQAEPTLTCAPYGAGYELTEVENFGLICYDVETAEPRCVDTTGHVGIYDPVDRRCESTVFYPNGIATNVLPDCTYLEGQGWRYTGEGCLRELREQPIQQCDIGTLNEGSGLCETRPGNRAAATTEAKAMTGLTYVQQGKACPEGFTLNKGTCEMEPEITTELVCPNNLPESPLGNCIVGIGSPISQICPSGFPYEFPSTQEQPINVCGSNPDGSGERVPKMFICAEDYELDTTIENVPRCFQVIPKVEQEIQEPCPTGSTLNTASGMCEVKPGRGGGNRA
jgi:hypothetical protein